MAIRSKTCFFFLILFWPALCLAAEDNCVSDSRTLLSIEELTYIAGDYISEGKITYSPSAQKDMRERFVEKSDIEYTLSYPAEVKTHFASDSNKHHVTGLPDKNGKQLRIEALF